MTRAPGAGADHYAATASFYDLVSAAARPGQLAAIESLLPLIHPEHGPVLDVGAGSGFAVETVLEGVPGSEVLALEPSPAMRALTLARIAAHPSWHHRVTVRPERFLEARLPDHIAGAVLLGVIGHFDPGERAAVLAELAARLPRGGAALLDLRSPERPQRVEPHELTVGTIGALTYRGIAEAWPTGGERMRWRMTYLTLEGERVLVEETTEHDYAHPSPEVLAAQAHDVGLRMRRIDGADFWLLERE